MGGVVLTPPVRSERQGWTKQDSLMQNIIRIHVSRTGEEELFRFLTQRNVIFVLARMNRDASEPVNPVRTIEVIRGLSTNESVGSAIVAWINARNSRHAVIHTKQREVIHVSGLASPELVRYLDDAEQISLVDPDANHPVARAEPLVDA